MTMCKQSKLGNHCIKKTLLATQVKETVSNSKGEELVKESCGSHGNVVNFYTHTQQFPFPV